MLFTAVAIWTCFALSRWPKGESDPSAFRCNLGNAILILTAIAV